MTKHIDKLWHEKMIDPVLLTIAIHSPIRLQCMHAVMKCSHQKQLIVRRHEFGFMCWTLMLIHGNGQSA